MSDKKISQLTDAGALQENDYTVIIREGLNYKLNLMNNIQTETESVSNLTVEEEFYIGQPITGYFNSQILSRNPQTGRVETVALDSIKNEDTSRNGVISGGVITQIDRTHINISAGYGYTYAESNTGTLPIFIKWNDLYNVENIDASIYTFNGEIGWAHGYYVVMGKNSAVNFYPIPPDREDFHPLCLGTINKNK